MKKTLLLFVFSIVLTNLGFSQTERAWSNYKGNDVKVAISAQRESFPQEFQLMELDLSALRQVLFTASDRFAENRTSAVISLPNAEGKLERFRVYEASNFAPDLQAQFPEIRSYVGQGIDDKYATARLSIDPKGIQTMVFRADKRNEFIEPYSEDGKVYAIYNSARGKGKLPFTCSTYDSGLANKLSFESTKKQSNNTLRSSTSEMLTFRLALSCTAEYSNYFGATSAARVGNVLAAFNNTMTRVNGVFERDLSIHMEVITQSQNVIYYTPSTDPYSPANIGSGGAWNTELQNNLSANLTGVGTSLAANNAVYDIGHLFGASGGGGNAGCIGCVCDNDTDLTTDKMKGSGYTSPSNGVPSGDTFDIDYVVHEMGHQFGANHTFSHSNEGSGVNMEVGSGSTIMGYAGITTRDVQAHSDDYFHVISIVQIESNMENKTCPVRTPISNQAPIVNAGINYTIPKSTPFILTGSATDANSDALTYCWEQIDNAASDQTAASSAASITKASGPNFRSYLPVSVPYRYFPKIQSVIANSATTAGSEVTVEALSSVARTLNFALTVRDRASGIGLTNTDVAIITVNSTAGPFAINIPSLTGLSYPVGSNQTITWNVAGTTANSINASHVDIFLSTDGGLTYPITLATGVPNDGSEVVTIPNNVGTQNRIMVKGHNHIFFDISNNNFAITAPTASFSLAYAGAANGQSVSICQGNSATYTLQYTPLAGFTGNTTFTATGNPANTTISFSPVASNSSTAVTLNLTSTSAVATGTYPIVVTGTSGTTTRTVNLYLTIVNGSFGTQALTSPANLAVGQSTSTMISWAANAAATSYDVEVASDISFSNIIASGTVTGTSTTISGLSEAANYFWRVKPKNAGCSGAFSVTYKFTTGDSNCTFSYSNNTPLNIDDGLAANTAGPSATKTIDVPNTVTGNINAIEVGLSLSHTYVQDLILELIHPDGTTIRLMNRNCDEGASATSPVSYTFNFTNDAASGLPRSSCLNPLITGDVKPFDAITVLNGKAAVGTWTLNATDWYNGDIGVINNWSINLCLAQPSLSNEDFSISNLAIYPNPNNGNFNIQFTSNSSNEINVGVHDMRGREIFTNKYSNNGLFNENLQLSNVQSGIYLVTIQDGSSKVTKKIVIE